MRRSSGRALDRGEDLVLKVQAAVSADGRAVELHDPEAIDLLAGLERVRLRAHDLDAQVEQRARQDAEQAAAAAGPDLQER
jgi:hypothetical protein